MSELVIIIFVCFVGGSAYALCLHWALGGFKSRGLAPKTNMPKEIFVRGHSKKEKFAMLENFIEHYTDINNDSHLDLVDFKPEQPTGSMEDNIFAQEAYTIQLVAFVKVWTASNIKKRSVR